MLGTVAGAAAGVMSASWRAASHLLLPANMTAMTSAVVAKRAEAEAEAMDDRTVCMLLIDY